mmetsp:Transcript_23687/g.38151  ORF Transcript_23687/g.38151 Transcript_23687/m.38151 type:complete len:237 (-) Transcript_23687:700-1410(-)
MCATVMDPHITCNSGGDLAACVTSASMSTGVPPNVATNSRSCRQLEKLVLSASTKAGLPCGHGGPSSIFGSIFIVSSSSSSHSNLRTSAVSMASHSSRTPLRWRYLTLTDGASSSSLTSTITATFHEFLSSPLSLGRLACTFSPTTPSTGVPSDGRILALFGGSHSASSSLPPTNSNLILPFFIKTALACHHSPSDSTSTIASGSSHSGASFHTLTFVFSFSTFSSPAFSESSFSS